MLLTSLYIIFTGAVVIGYSYFVQGNVLTKQLESDSGKTMQVWAQKISIDDAEAAKGVQILIRLYSRKYPNCLMSYRTHIPISPRAIFLDPSWLMGIKLR